MLNDPKSWTGFNMEQDLKSIDIIAFPEMAFTGYNFEHHAHVLPMACLLDQGDDFDFAR
jgi:predicted amidohydrolase